ncbi:uncharacterized protein LOC123660346 [Melitaea cinxia]|uniref:uncharacterized protein LOC123660346 n=1 Tax=Melitaea cinxia TaxID=113334 RepID=UPI001E27437C|nr:uncharacterized protein LOC123660346 [Melitaea cinxia]
MCLAKEGESPSQREEVQPPRSPWMKLLSRQSSKRKLPRKVTSSTRVNLNKYWSKLEELISNSSPRPDLPSHKTVYPEEPILVPFSEYFYPVDPVKPVTIEDNDNAENQNILNSSRFELVSEEEISDNMANEIREICYAATKTSCLICKLCCL